MASIAGVNLALASVLLMVPILGGDFLAWQIGLFLLYGVAAQGVGFAWGRGGFLPLGNALFFGAGAYTAAMMLKASGGALWISLSAMLAFAMLAGALAFALAAIIFRGRHESGPSFSLITLALVLIASQLAETSPTVTGGFNGYGGYPPLAGLDPFSSLYYLIVALVVVVTSGLMAINRVPAGLVLSAMTAQEERLQILGFATHRIKGWAFAVSAFVGTLAGGLYASHQGIVTPQTMGFALSAEMVIWAAVGGRLHPLGPLVGAVILGFVSSELRDVFPWWEVAVAVLFLVVVLLVPGGMVDIARRLLPPRKRRGAGCPEVEAPGSRASRPVGLLGLEEVVLSAGGVAILNGLTVDFQPQSTTCVIGPNGAGKTTMLNAITGRLSFQSGRIVQEDVSLKGRRPYDMLSFGIGRKMQVPAVFNGLTVAQNLQIALLAARARPWDMMRRAPLWWRSPAQERLLSHPKVPLQAVLNTPAESLPQGHRQMLELAMTIAAEPQILLLDEPAAGMSPEETGVMVELIRGYQAATGATVIVIEHDMALVEQLAGEVVVLHQGRMLARGTLDQIRSNADVKAVYAGGHK